MHPRIASLAHVIDGSIHDAAAGDHRATPVLASTPRSNLAVGRPVDVACHRGSRPTSQWLWLATGPVKNVSALISGIKTINRK